METVSRASKRRARQRLYAAALEARGEHRRAKKLLRCVLEDERKEATGYCNWRCQHRNCLFCCWRYVQRLRVKFTREIERYLGDGYRMSFGTFTVPNTPSLSREQYKWLSKKLRRLLRRRPFKGRVFAAVAVIESDFNSDSQDWHVHIHIILIYDLCIPQREIEDAWRDLVNSEFNYVQSDVPGRVNPPCIVWIKKVELEDLRQTVNYLFKPQTFDNADAFAEYDCAVRNIRLVHSYGALRGRNGHSRKA